MQLPDLLDSNPVCLIAPDYLQFAGPTDPVREIPAPAPALPPSDPFFDLPSPLLVRAGCYQLHATIYFEPNSDIYLNATAGTSNAITQAISNQTLSSGVQVRITNTPSSAASSYRPIPQPYLRHGSRASLLNCPLFLQADLYLRNVTLAPSITSVVTAGATLQHITEVGYISAIWVPFCS